LFDDRTLDISDMLAVLTLASVTSAPRIAVTATHKAYKRIGVSGSHQRNQTPYVHYRGTTHNPINTRGCPTIGRFPDQNPRTFDGGYAEARATIYILRLVFDVCHACSVWGMVSCVLLLVGGL